MRALVLLLGALALGGCMPETPSLNVVTDDVQADVTSSDSDTTTIPQGTAVAFAPYLSREEIEGGPTLLPVDDVRSDDPSTVRVSHATREYQIQWPSTNEHAFVMIGLVPGQTTVRLYRGDDEVGSFPIVVVAQVD